MARVLYVYGGVLLRGGTESYMMNCLRHFSPGLQVDFAVHGGERGVFDDEIEARGGVIHRLPVRSRDPQGHKEALREAIGIARYAAVHSHADTANAHILKMAALCGVPLRISHSHNTAVQGSRWHRWLGDYEKRQIPRSATHLFACGEAAGRWLYGKNPFTVFPNAIELGRFLFNEDARRELRGQLGVGETATVLCHVGRFCYQKNQAFLLDVMEKVTADALLLLIGDGEDRPEIEQQIIEKNLQNRVRIIGPTDEVNRYLQAADIFLLPSRFEGLPVTMIEAQAAGLPCLVSEAVTREAAVVPGCRFMPLDAGRWAAEIDRLSDSAARPNTEKKLTAAGYDIEEQAARLENFYNTGVLT